MVTNCPFCGFLLNRPVKNGIKCCGHCHSFFETTNKNKLLSAAWAIQKEHNIHPDQFKFFHDLDDTEYQMVYNLVVEEGYNHDELLGLLDVF